MIWDVVVVGAGAAGLLCAAKAASRGKKCLLLEKNNKTGVKILISGGTRCNITHAIDASGIANAFEKKQGKFLRSALAALPPEKLIEIIESQGVQTKVESTGKIFPVSDRAIDVRDALLNFAIESGAKIRTNFVAQTIDKNQSGQFEIKNQNETVCCIKIVIACGGKSYPECGTAGDGYVWAKSLGHSIVPPVPALTPVTTDVDWVRDLKGLTIADCDVGVIANNQIRDDGTFSQKDLLAQRRSSLLMTHFGLSGPSVLDVSRAISRHAKPGDLALVCNFLPAIGNVERISATISEHFQHAKSRQIDSLLQQMLANRLAIEILANAKVERNKKVAEVSNKEILRIATEIGACKIPVSGTRGFKKAEVTAGGVSLTEVKSSTLESKLVEGLYFIGEILDIDGPIGGFNFQAAFSTGWLAGHSL